MIRVFEAQRLVSLTTIFDLADNLEKALPKARSSTPPWPVNWPREFPTSNSRAAPSPEARANSLSLRLLHRKAHRAAAKNSISAEPCKKRRRRPEQAEGTAGTLAPFLRDTLVGYNYIHYAPPWRAGPATHESPSSSVTTISSAFKALARPGKQLSCSAPAGPPTPAADWSVRWLLCPTPWPKPSKTS